MQIKIHYQNSKNRNNKNVPNEDLKLETDSTEGTIRESYGAESGLEMQERSEQSKWQRVSECVCV